MQLFLKGHFVGQRFFVQPETVWMDCIHEKRTLRSYDYNNERLNIILFSNKQSVKRKYLDF